MSKKELQDIIKNPSGKLIAVDLDGTLSKGTFWGTEQPEPITERIDWLWEKIYKRGGHVIIWTARDPRWYQETRAWLIKHNVPYHGIAMQKKIGAHLYIDDKALNIEDVWSK